ncbi:MAG: hypothetical protein D6805_05000, partial [Planctomycetota bacterium]
MFGLRQFSSVGAVVFWQGDEGTIVYRREGEKPERERQKWEKVAEDLLEKQISHIHLLLPYGACRYRYVEFSPHLRRRQIAKTMAFQAERHIPGLVAEEAVVEGMEVFSGGEKKRMLLVAVERKFLHQLLQPLQERGISVVGVVPELAGVLAFLQKRLPNDERYVARVGKYLLFVHNHQLVYHRYFQADCFFSWKRIWFWLPERGRELDWRVFYDFEGGKLPFALQEGMERKVVSAEEKDSFERLIGENLLDDLPPVLNLAKAEVGLPGLGGEGGKKVYLLFLCALGLFLFFQNIGYFFYIQNQKKYYADLLSFARKQWRRINWGEKKRPFSRQMYLRKIKSRLKVASKSQLAVDPSIRFLEFLEILSKDLPRDFQPVRFSFKKGAFHYQGQTLNRESFLRFKDKLEAL